MKIQYDTPEMELIRFTAGDIITLNDGSDNWGGDGGGEIGD